jgi:hypothetical protein
MNQNVTSSGLPKAICIETLYNLKTSRYVWLTSSQNTRSDSSDSLGFGSGILINFNTQHTTENRQS